MDALLIPACILLALTNLSFAVLANHWRCEAKRLEIKNGLLLSRWNTQQDQRLADGVVLGEQRAYDRMYTAALKAWRAHGDILQALRDVGKVVDDDVQVLEEV